MSQKSGAKLSTKPSPEPATKVVVFGVDNVDWLPRAGWFPQSQADAAYAVAKQLHLNVVEVTNGIAADLGAAIPEGRIHMKGPNAVPTVREDLYEKVVATINPSADPTRPDPAAWDAIKPGHLVLAHENLRLGWYEAVVVAKAGDKVTLRWRDYGGHPPFTVPAASVALVGAAQS